MIRKRIVEYEDYFCDVCGREIFSGNTNLCKEHWNAGPGYPTKWSLHMLKDNELVYRRMLSPHELESKSIPIPEMK